ncbi:glycosyltransferase family 2 protein [Bifidobacterium avesanii]|nr:glycosyltransferase family 2 protein [Bifidobacterium avesanii]
MPTYNRSTLIGRSITSILQQDYQDFELIIVDDGSTDDTESVVRQFNDLRIHYYYQKNQGACVARNYGISLAKGSVLAFQDSDDVWLPKKLSTQLANLEANKSDIDICQMQTISVENKVIDIQPAIKIVNKGLGYPTILETNFVSTQMIVAKKSVLDENKFDPTLPRFQDWDLAIRILKKGNKLSFTDQILVEQHISSDSITTNVSKALKAYANIENKYKEDLINNKKEYSNFLYYKVLVCRDGLTTREKRALLKKSVLCSPNIRNILRFISCN